MKSLEPSHPRLPACKLGRPLVLKALMLCCCSANSPVVPFPSTPKSVKSSTQMESLQLEFMLSCPFFSTKRCTFLLWNRLKTSFFTCSYRKAIGEKNAVIAVRVSSFQFVKQPASFFPFKILQKAARPEPQISGAFLWKYLTSLL